jgi:hypothetical protein
LWQDAQNGITIGIIIMTDVVWQNNGIGFVDNSGPAPSISVIAGESCLPGQPLYVHPASQRARLCCATALATGVAIGLASTTGTIGFPVSVATEQLSLADWSAVVGSPTLLPGVTYFLDTAPGRLTPIAPTTIGYLVAPIGKAATTSSLILSIPLPFLL